MMNVNGRDLEILHWLVHMKFMLLEQIRDAFFKGCNPYRSPYRRILKLMKEGLIAKRKVYIEPKDIYLPTKKAVLLLRSKGFPYAMDVSRDQTFFSYGHDKVVTDLRIFFKDLDIQSFIPERVIRSIKPYGACPDGLILTSNASYALEYEHTEKRFIRYKEIMKRYWDREKYTRVIYITSSASLIERILKRYDVSPNIFFVTKEELFKSKVETVFQSTKGICLLIKDMLHHSVDADMRHFPPSFIEEIVKPRPDESWKERKPFIPAGGGSHCRKKKKEEAEKLREPEEDDSDSSYYPRIHPPIYPTDPGHDSWEDDV